MCAITSDYSASTEMEKQNPDQKGQRHAHFICLCVHINPNNVWRGFSHEVLVLLSLFRTHRDLTQSRHRQCCLTRHNNWDPATFWRQSRPQKIPRALSLWWLTRSLPAEHMHTYIKHTHAFSVQCISVFTFNLLIKAQSWTDFNVCQVIKGNMKYKCVI